MVEKIAIAINKEAAIGVGLHFVSSAASELVRTRVSSRRCGHLNMAARREPGTAQRVEMVVENGLPPTSSFTFCFANRNVLSSLAFSSRNTDRSAFCNDQHEKCSLIYKFLVCPLHGCPVFSNGLACCSRPGLIVTTSVSK